MTEIASPAKGKFGPYGGQFVPETLMPALAELEEAYEVADAIERDAFDAVMIRHKERYRVEHKSEFSVEQMVDMATDYERTLAEHGVELGVVANTVADELSEAYKILRGVEHRIQMLNDEQTHTLPAQRGKGNDRHRSISRSCRAHRSTSSSSWGWYNHASKRRPCAARRAMAFSTSYNRTSTKAETGSLP